MEKGRVGKVKGMGEGERESEAKSERVKRPFGRSFDCEFGFACKMRFKFCARCMFESRGCGCVFCVMLHVLRCVL